MTLPGQFSYNGESQVTAYDHLHHKPRPKEPQETFKSKKRDSLSLLDVQQMKSILGLLKQKFSNFKDFTKIFKDWSDGKPTMNKDDFMKAMNRIGRFQIF